MATLETLPAPDASAEFVMTFTVLQHMPDAAAEASSARLTRVLAPGGHIWSSRKPTRPWKPAMRPMAEAGYTRGRPWSWYSAPTRAAALDSDGPPDH